MPAAQVDHATLADTEIIRNILHASQQRFLA
jgi:hypothetical protein